jgi:hypothetical protein
MASKRDYLRHVMDTLESARLRLIAAEGEGDVEAERHERDAYKGLLHTRSYTLMEATRALLAATEPASDEEVARSLQGAHRRGWTLKDAYRAAEARVRRLAGLGEEG